jgi:hypothetical protein
VRTRRESDGKRPPDDEEKREGGLIIAEGLGVACSGVRPVFNFYRISLRCTLGALQTTVRPITHRKKKTEGAKPLSSSSELYSE